VEPSILERPEHPVSRRDIDSNVLKILYRLINAGFVAYLVGGSVRDLMMGRRPKDFDIGTSAHPQHVRDLFRNSRLIGRRFRLVHVFFGPQNIEVATFRRRSEEQGDGDPMIRHDNTFGTPEEDAFRRDFTVNSLFYDPLTFRVIDYTGGVADLRARLIRAIDDPETRMREDPIRMIRAIRFAAKLGFEIEPSTKAAIRRHAGDLAKASIPRLVEETYRTLLQSRGTEALMLLEEMELLPVILPALSAHLRCSSEKVEQSVTMRSLGALGRALEAGFEPSRPFGLACLFADLHLTSRKMDETKRVELVEMLRRQGFSRADTDQMRLLLDAVVHMIERSRITRRLTRRPYFATARTLFDMIAPGLQIDPAELDRFLENAAPVPMPRRRRRGRRGMRRSADALVTTTTVEGSPTRRRRRRRGRSRSNGIGPPTLESNGAARGEPAVDSGPLSSSAELSESEGSSDDTLLKPS
jgi:poly(A) polymerase